MSRIMEERMSVNPMRSDESSNVRLVEVYEFY